MIPSATIERARSILTSQPYVPASPAITATNNDVYVCGAAALALAGIEKKEGSEAANEFCATVCSMSKDQLENVYERLGWTRDLCNKIRECNDAARPAARLRVVIEKMGELALTQAS